MQLQIESSLGFIPDLQRRGALAEYVEGIPRRKGRLVSQDVIIELLRYCQKDEWLDPYQMRQLLATGVIPGSARLSGEAYAAKVATYGEWATPQLFLPIPFERALINTPFQLWEIGRVEDMVNSREKRAGGLRTRSDRVGRLLQAQFECDGLALSGAQVLERVFRHHKEKLARRNLVMAAANLR